MTAGQDTGLPAEPEDVFGDAPPHDIAAERALLGAMMFSEQASALAAQHCQAGDFYRPAHRVAFGAIVAMRACGEPVDPRTLMEWITRDGDLAAFGARPDMYLAGLYDAALSTPVPAHTAAGVADLAVRRRLGEMTTRTAQRLTAPRGVYSTGELLAGIQGELDTVARAAADADDPLAGPVTAQAFTGVHRVVRPPVIPGLIHRQDRVIAVAPEGAGKTMLSLQVAVMTAAGVHCFAHEPIEPQPVLIIDFENPRDEMQDRLERMLGMARHYPGWDEGNLRIWSHPRGINLLDPASQFRLAQVIRKAAPRLVIGGPIWKMFRVGRDGHEGAAWGLTDMWDELRARYDFALWLEAHPTTGLGGRRVLRPKGGEIWQAWPEFGLALHTGPKGEPEGSLGVGTFRGHRIAGRMWPEVLHRRMHDSGWPWEARYPQGTLADATADEDTSDDEGLDRERMGW